MVVSINLPKRLRLSLKLERKRGRPEKPLLPTVGEILREKENKTSFFFKHIFEHKKINRIIGTNLAFLIVASSFIPASNTDSETLEINSIASPVVLNTEESLHYPVKNVRITQNFHFYRPGIDFDGVTGDAIYPIMAGRVEKVEYSRFGYGKSITISHGSDLESLYAHLSKIEVVEKQEVTKETKLGEMGTTRRAFGDHLHLEIYENGKPINPLTILPR